MSNQYKIQKVNHGFIRQISCLFINIPIPEWLLQILGIFILIFALSYKCYTKYRYLDKYNHFAVIVLAMGQGVAFVVKD